jgi:Rrf2 family protein
MFSQTTEYALRAAVWLASRADSAQTTEQIACGTHVPAGYLSKVLQTLGKAGVVQSQRGLGGGFTLTRPPTETTVLEIINAIEPLRRIRECPLSLEPHGTELCPLHARIDGAVALLEEHFRDCTIADLCSGTPATTPLCVEPIPRPQRGDQQ